MANRELGAGVLDSVAAGFALPNKAPEAAVVVGVVLAAEVLPTLPNKPELVLGAAEPRLPNKPPAGFVSSFF